ncbi:MAG: RcnB family protein [Rhizomicrobium sp.]
MKTLFICAAALGLLVAAPALSAQDDSHHNARQGAAAQGAAHAAPAAGAHQNVQGRSMTTQPHTRSVGTFQNAPGSGASHTRSVGTHQNSHAVATDSQRFLPASGDTTHSQTGRSSAGASQMQTGGNARNGSARSNSGTAANTAGHHPSINSMRLNVQATHQFHNGNYNAPTGYQARRWSYGDRLPHGYYNRNYWLTDYLMFGLFAPPDGLVWVRVGDDALLVDEISGDVVQVDYGVFY